jgi:ribosomal-protein-alanine N-acetyltransferase
MNFFIRKMTLDDLPQVIAIDQASFSLPWPERSFRFEIIDNPTARCWVVEADGHVTAELILWIIVNEAHIATIATHPDFRRLGIGNAILLHALKSAAEQGATSAYLEVRASNLAAQDLYRKFGFVEMARRAQYYKDNTEDAVLMRLKSLRMVSLPLEDGGMR